MVTIDQQGAVGPPPSVLAAANIVYALHSFAIVVGIIGTATVIGSFVGSVPSIVAVIINYVKRGESRGTWVESHYRWQIRTFWFALVWAIIGWVLIFTLIGALIGIPVLIGLTIWLMYRIVAGWLRLRDRRPMYV